MKIFAFNFLDSGAIDPTGKIVASGWGWVLTPLPTETLGDFLVACYDETGTIEPNKRADLVVLRENPRTAIANTSSIESVVKSGVVHTHRDLRARYE